MATIRRIPYAVVVVDVANSVGDLHGLLVWLSWFHRCRC